MLEGTGTPGESKKPGRSTRSRVVDPMGILLHGRQSLQRHKSGTVEDGGEMPLDAIRRLHLQIDGNELCEVRRGTGRNPAASPIRACP